MSIASVDVIIDRIKVATPNSPISVFTVQQDNRRVLDARFTDTVAGRRESTIHNPNFVGKFHKHNHIERIRQKLYSITGES